MIGLASHDCPVILQRSPVQDILDLEDELRHSESTGKDAILAMKEETIEQAAVLKRMTPDQKWRVAASLYWQARAWKAASLKMFHPDWSGEKINAAVRELFSHGSTG
jgi:hypothetical protein